MRNIESKDLVGKTISSIDNSAVNYLKIQFTDGTTLEFVAAYLELCAEDAVNTPNGSVPGIFVLHSK